MFKISTICLLLLAFSHISNAIYEPIPYPFLETDHIIFLGEPTWGYALREIDSLLVFYYDNQCLSCFQFFSEYTEVAKNLFNAKSAVRLAKTECFDEFAFCNFRGITTFPTIILYRRDKEPLEYKGARTAADLQAWVQRVVDFKYDVIDEEAGLFKNFSTAILVNEKIDAVNQYYADHSTYLAIAQAGSSLKSKLQGNPAVILTQSREVVPLSLSDTVNEITNKAEKLFHHDWSVLMNFDTEYNAKLEDDREIFDAVLFFRTNSFKVFGKENLAFQNVSQEYKHQGYRFFYVNVADNIFGANIGKLFGVTEDSGPTIGVLSKVRRLLKKYKMEDSITRESLTKFIKNQRAGNVKRYYMSAEISKQKPHHFVQEIVGSDYVQMTQSSEKSVFVMTYFPWCVWCKKFDPTWESLAYRLRHSKKISFAKIDVSKNDIPGVDIVEHPTLLFYPQGSAEPILYQSSKYVNDIKNFLNSHIDGLLNDYEL